MFTAVVGQVDAEDANGELVEDAHFESAGLDWARRGFIFGAWTTIDPRGNVAGPSAGDGDM